MDFLRFQVTSHQAITSFTVPPSTVFQTTPISYHPAVSNTGEASSVVRKGKQRQRYTAVGVGKGENISHADEGKVVWIWKGEEVFEQSTLKVSLSKSTVSSTVSTETAPRLLSWTIEWTCSSGYRRHIACSLHRQLVSPSSPPS
jgi:hypothetical protein